MIICVVLTHTTDVYIVAQVNYIYSILINLSEICSVRIYLWNVRSAFWGNSQNEKSTRILLFALFPYNYV